MRAPSRASAGTTAGLLAAALVLVAGSGSQAAPTSPANQRTDDGSKDYRQGQIAPTAAQKAAADGMTARWNRFGTPASLTATAEPLDEGLPADPAAAARAYIAGNRDVLGLTAAGAESLELLTTAPLGEGAAVVFRQRFGDLAAGRDGLLSLGVRDGKVWYVSSSLARDAAPPAPATLSADQATAAAKSEAGIPDATVLGTKLVAVPTADRGARAAYQVTIADDVNGADPIAYTSYVDARDGKVLVRDDIVDADSDHPEWEVFPANPPTDYSSRDTRRTWCWAGGPGCDENVRTSASPLAWDVIPGTREPSFTTRGNNAIAVENWNSSDPFTVGTETATPRPNREYDYPWTNQWYRERCAPTTFESPAKNDIDAARANLFAMHNRMHD